MQDRLSQICHGCHETLAFPFDQGSARRLTHRIGLLASVNAPLCRRPRLQRPRKNPGLLSMTGVGLSGESAPYNGDLAMTQIRCTADHAVSVALEISGSPKSWHRRNWCRQWLPGAGTLDAASSGRCSKQCSEHLHLALALCTILQQRPTLGLRTAASEKSANCATPLTADC